MATLSAPERALYIKLRNMQIQRRLVESTWDQIVPVDRSLGPTLDLKYSKLDHNVDITRWRTGNPRLGTVQVAVGDDTIKFGFYGFQLTQGWFDRWLRENMIAGENAALWDQRSVFDINRMQQLGIDALERTIETDFYNGNAEIGWDGMITLAGTAESIVSDLSLEAGRQEFYDALIAAMVTAKNPGGDDRRVGGTPVLAIDSSLLPYLDHQFDVGSGNPRTAIEYIRGLNGGNISIVPVENAALAGKALLHWKDNENIVAYDGTPNGVVLAVDADANQQRDAHRRVFTNIAFHEFRDNSLKLFDSLAPA